MNIRPSRGSAGNAQNEPEDVHTRSTLAGMWRYDGPRAGTRGRVAQYAGLGHARGGVDREQVHDVQQLPQCTAQLGPREQVVRQNSECVLGPEVMVLFPMCPMIGSVEQENAERKKLGYPVLENGSHLAPVARITWFTVS